MSDKDPQPYDIAKNKEAMDLARKIRDQAEKERPELKRLREKFTAPAPPEEQKLWDEMEKELTEKLRKGSGQP